MMLGTTTYFDITDLLRDAASELNEGEFIAGKDFVHVEAMRAIDISDPKVDVGMGLMGVKSMDISLNTVSECLHHLNGRHDSMYSIE